VRTEAIVLVEVVIQDHLRLGDPIEQIAVQAFGLQGAGEALDERVLPGTSRCDVERLAALIREPFLTCFIYQSLCFTLGVDLWAKYSGRRGASAPSRNAHNVRLQKPARCVNPAQ